jgi:uncharacterized protein YqfA (UPF0365 family)
MVQGATHRIADHQSFDKLSTIMRAVGADGEELIARASEHDVIVAGTSEKHAAILKCGDDNSRCEIRSCRVAGIVHVNLAVGSYSGGVG